MSKEKYAIWYSVLSDYEKIMGNFIADNNKCQFEEDFNLENNFIDYEHAIIIWYGERQGELGFLSSKDNPVLEDGFDFITSEVSNLLQKKNIEQISCLLAVPDIEYTGKIKSNNIFCFGGYVNCERLNSSWLDDILNGM